MTLAKNRITIKSPSIHELDQKMDSIIRLCKSSTDYTVIQNRFISLFRNLLYPVIPFQSTTNQIIVYRVTKPRENFDIKNPDTFSFNPNPIDYGRAHTPSHPVFYGACNEATALREMKQDLKEGERFYLSEWEINFHSTINIHSLMYEEVTKNKRSIMNYHADEIAHKSIQKTGIRHPKDVANLKYYFTTMAKLFSLKESTYYPITSAYSHLLMYEARKVRASVDIIAYPSVCSSYSVANYAIHPELVRNGAVRLKKVREIYIKQVLKDSINPKTMQLGYLQGERINWS